MSGKVLDAAGTVTGSAAGALLCRIVLQYLSSGQYELYSEAICWLVLLVISASFTGPNDNRFLKSTPHIHRQIQSGRTVLWAVAGSLCIAAVFKTELGVIVFTPALIPILLTVEQRLGCLPLTSIATASLPSQLVDTTSGTASVALFITCTLISCSSREQDYLVIPATALLFVYIALTPRADKGPRFFRFIPPLKIEDALVSLSLRVAILLVAIIGIEIYIFGYPRCNAIATMGLGIIKALFWLFLIQTAQYSSWRIAPTIETFTLVATHNPFTQNSDLQVLAYVVASILSLSQVIHLLPKEVRLRSTLWSFCLVSLIPYLSNVAFIENPPSAIHTQQHPVEALVRTAKASFEHMLQQQSQNFTVARDEYRRRYDVEPPPGFKAWYEFAKSKQSQIIDEFDIIHERISPFWSLSGKEILEIMDHVQSAKDSELWLCSFCSSRAHVSCTHPSRTFDRHLQLLLNSLLGDLRNAIPDIKFLVNHIDEPSVLIPPRLPDDPHKYAHYNTTTFSRQRTWDALTKFCPSETRMEDIQNRSVADTFGIPFVTSPRSALDLCRHPEYKDMHGLTTSPTSFHLIEGMVPVLSTGSLSTMGDILFPSPAYSESEFQYDSDHDVPWEQKRSNLYWMGSTTGGFAADSRWRNFHRQRFVGFAQNLEKKQYSYLREEARTGTISRIKSSFLNGRLFDVAFARIFQCERKYCRDQRMHFQTKSWSDKDEGFKSRLLFDLDGNGISGRYYKLLASNSVPLKQTLLREWHDERLVPWIHYVPVSQSLEELPELVSYLTSSPNGAGQKTAREIAEQGQAWFSKAFREADMAVYVYRLLLELARLQDPERPANTPRAGRS